MGRRMERGLPGEAGVLSEEGEAPNRPLRKGECGKTDGALGRRDSNPLMPGLRVRSDGWTGARTRVFLASLAQTGCVSDAARIAGVSTTSVNRSRRLFAPFDRACAEALAKALRGLEAVAWQRAVEGRETIVIRGGKEVERRVMPSDSILALLLKRGELGGPDAPGVAVPGQRRYDPEATINAAEHFEGWRFDPKGIKYFHPTSAIARLGDRSVRVWPSMTIGGRTPAMKARGRSVESRRATRFARSPAAKHAAPPGGSKPDAPWRAGPRLAMMAP